MTETLALPWISIGNAVNLRDTGGLACRDGATTRHRALLRSGTLRQLTAGDAATLMEVCGVRTVLDLRTARELPAEGPSAPARAGLATVHLPLIRDDRLAFPEAEDQADVTAALRRAYQSYLDERGHHIATAARLVAASAGATLVHCAAGKDRTGVTVALLLDVVGVERSEVIADYVATNDVLAQVMTTLGTMYGYVKEVERADLSAHLARPAALNAVLERLDDEHGGAAGWLRGHGLDDVELAALRHRLVRPHASVRLAAPHRR